MINYFYNITSKEDKLNFYTDVLTNIRKDFYLNKEKVKGKITQNSSLDTVYYEFSLAKDRSLKWNVSDNNHILSDCKNLDDGKYCVCYYGDGGLYKQITFSKFHTLLKVEYFNKEKTSTPYFIIEPRKSNNGLCLLVNVVGSYQSVLLFPMPQIDDEYISDMIDSEFDNYCAVASTNEGVVRFLDSVQLEEFDAFVEKAKMLKEKYTAPQSFISKEDAVLADKLNPKDFNVKKNLSQAIDITQADEFSYEADDAFDNVFESKVDGYVEAISDEADANVTVNFEEITGDNGKVADEVLENTEVVETAEFGSNEDSFEEIALGDSDEYEPIVSNFVEYTIAGVVTDGAEDETATQVVVEETVDETCDVTEDTQQITAPVDNADVCDDAIDELPVDDSYESEEATPVDNSIEIQVEDVPEESETVLQKAVCDKAANQSDESEKQEEVDTEEFSVGEDVSPTSVIETGSSRYMYYGELDATGGRVGFGRTTTDDGRTAYEGEYHNNKRNGIGSYYYKDGTLCYFGNWVNNKREGFGVGVSSFDKSIHVGNFSDNKPQGDGARIDSNGEVKFVKKSLSNGMSVMLEFEDDKVIIRKYNQNEEIISENSSNLKYF